MNCTQCGSEVVPGSRFCHTCGAATVVPEPAAEVNPAFSSEIPGAKPGLGLAAAQALVSIFFLWATKSIVNGLSYVRDLNIPEIDLPVTLVTDAVIAVLIILVLVRFANQVLKTWPQRFPAYAQVRVPLAAVFYLIAISQFYKAAEQLVNFFFVDPIVLTIIQLILLVLTAAVIVRAAQIIYRDLPRWITAIVAEGRRITE